MSNTIIILVNIILAVVLAVGLTPVWVWWERELLDLYKIEVVQIDVILDL